MVLKNPKITAARGDRGAVLVLSVLLMTSLIGVTAFVVDLGNARQTARHTQGAADAAALAGSQDLPSGVANPTMALKARNTARTYAVSSLGGSAAGAPCDSQAGYTCTFTVGAATVTATTPYTLAGSAVDPNSLLRVTICKDTPALFSKVWAAGSNAVCRESVARTLVTTAGVGVGLVAMSPSLQCAVSINGNNTVTITGGALLANSTANPAICGSSASACGSMDLNATLVSASGTVSDCVETIVTTGPNPGTVVEGADSFGDPFLSLPDTVCTSPSTVAGGCTTATSPLVPTATGSCSSSMTPGYFATGCSFNGNGTVTMTPGVYWFNDNFDPGGRDVTCPTCSSAAGGVLMYFYNGSLSHTGNGTVDLLPYQAGQTSGNLYAGMSVYQRRTNDTTMTLGGNASSGLGSIYALAATVNMHGNVVRTINGIIVANRFDFNGNTTTTVNPPPGGVTTDPILDIGLEL
jgi:Flp pilus assembly protein TadG